MKKTILFTLALVFLVATVSAISEGDIYSQEQLNNFDLENYTFPQFVSLLECQMEDNGHWERLFDSWVYRKEFSCFQLDVYNETHFIVHRRTYKPTVSLNKFLTCVAHPDYTQQDCVDLALQQLNVIQPIRMVRKIWYEIIKFRTVPVEPDDYGFWGDIW